MKTKNNFAAVLLSTAFLFSVSSVYAEEQMPMKDMQSKIEMHEHMSKMHKDAADCLKSGKSEKECKTAMMSDCKEHMKSMPGDMSCSMMEKMHSKMGGNMKK